MKRCWCSVVERNGAKKLEDVRAESCKNRIEDVLLDNWKGLVLIACFIQFKLLLRGGENTSLAYFKQRARPSMAAKVSGGL